MAFLRPPCAAFARRLCASQSQLEQSSRSPLLDLLQRHHTSRLQCRFFGSTRRRFAEIVDTPLKPTIPHTPKRTVRIGSLPNGQVEDKTVRRIFGPRVSGTDGNNVLRILHHRRTVGSLADYGVDNLGKQYTHVDRALAMKGLEWLREKYPMDEARAAEEWAEKEANRIQYELWLADPETESKYKDPARAYREEVQKQEQEQQQHELDHQKMGILHVGKSQFELNIEERRRQRLEEATMKAEEKEQREKNMEAQLATGEWVRTPSGTQLMKPGQVTYVDLFGREQVSRRKEETERYQKRSHTEFSSPEEMLASTTLAQRLYPMTAFVLIAVLLSYGFAHYYLPPSPTYRILPDLSPTTATIGTLFLANCVIAAAWRIMPLWPFMTRYFMHVPGYPRAVQSVLNVFSHVQYEHLLSNMMMLALVGPACHDLVGRGVFLGTYISAGAVGTLATLYWANLGRGSITAHSVGASAAIWGISALFCLLTDTETLKIPYIKDTEVTFWPKMLFAAFVAFEIRSALRGKSASMDHASHFGGMAVGMGVAGYLRATGARDRVAMGDEAVQAKAQVEAKTLDVGAVARQEIKEIRDSFGSAR